MRELLKDGLVVVKVVVASASYILCNDDAHSTRWFKSAMSALAKVGTQLGMGFASRELEEPVDICIFIGDQWR